jgi:hypothetical protein
LTPYKASQSLKSCQKPRYRKIQPNYALTRHDQPRHGTICQRTVADARASVRGIHPRKELRTKSDRRKTDRGKNERFFANKWLKNPMEQKSGDALQKRREFNRRQTKKISRYDENSPWISAAGRNLHPNRALSGKGWGTDACMSTLALL